MLSGLVSGCRTSRDWEAGRVVAFQLRTKLAANAVPGRPGPSSCHAGVAQCVTKGTQPFSAGPDISAGDAVPQTRGHSNL
jgi:hypothetical protein